MSGGGTWCAGSGFFNGGSQCMHGGSSGGFFGGCDDLSFGSSPRRNSLDCAFNTTNGGLVLAGIIVGSLICCCGMFLTMGRSRTLHEAYMRIAENTPLRTTEAKTALPRKSAYGAPPYGTPPTVSATPYVAPPPSNSYFPSFYPTTQQPSPVIAVTVAPPPPPNSYFPTVYGSAEPPPPPQMTVTVPPGMGPGQTMAVNVNGQVMNVTIPTGVGPGMSFGFAV